MSYKESVRIECKECGQIYKIYVDPDDYELIHQNTSYVDDIDYLSEEEKILLIYQLCKDCYDETCL